MASLKLLHFCASLGAFIAVWLCFFSKIGEPNYSLNVDILVILLYTVLMFFLFRSYDVYNIGYARTRGDKRNFRRFIYTCCRMLGFNS